MSSYGDILDIGLPPPPPRNKSLNDMYIYLSIWIYFFYGILIKNILNNPIFFLLDSTTEALPLQCPKRVYNIILK